MASIDPVAIVTGAAQGLGFSISERLLQEGYKVCLGDVNDSKGKESLAHLQGKYGADKVIYVNCDVTSKDSFEAAFSKTLKEFGRIDLLVNNAGISEGNKPELIVQVNLMGPIIGCQLALKFMGTSNGGKGGVVVNVASILGLLKLPFAPVYSATKHAVVGLTRCYGDQFHLDRNGVLFMAICPHAIRTPMFASAQPLKVSKDIVSAEIMEPEYVAQGVIKLLKDKENGSTLLIMPDKMQYIGIPEEMKNIIL